MNTRPPAALLAVALLLGACASTGRADGSAKIETTEEANRESLESAAQAPLRDFNVVRTQIPAVLINAMAAPYQRPKSTRCAYLAQLLLPLDQALGADLDTASVDEDDLLDKGRGTALGVAATAASSAIPFRGWVRKLTGAEQHDKTVQAAIVAGAVRRAYLKGLGESKGCPPPATPSHVLDAPATPPPPKAGGPPPPSTPQPRGPFTPRYPTR